MHPNLQFGVLAAVGWFLAGQDLEPFQLIEDLVGPGLQFIFQHLNEKEREVRK